MQPASSEGSNRSLHDSTNLSCNPDDTGLPNAKGSS
jgi:hypothetical protein